MLFVHLFDLRLFDFVCFLFLLVYGKGCSLRLWHSLDFSLTLFTASKGPENIMDVAIRYKENICVVTCHLTPVKVNLNYHVM